MGATLLAFGSAVVGAILGAYLQRRWTPDPSAEIAGLRQQLVTFQERVETLERERVETEHFALTVSLLHAHSGYYALLVKNDSDEEVTVEAVNFARGDVELSTAARSKTPGEWTIGPRSGRQLQLAPTPDPVATLRTLEPALGAGTASPIVIVLGCRVRGRPITFRRSKIVTVDYRNLGMMQFGP